MTMTLHIQSGPKCFCQVPVYKDGTPSDENV